MATEDAVKLPMFWVHGTDDGLVKYKFGRECAEYIVAELGVKEIPEEVDITEVESLVGLKFHTYDGLGHAVCEK